jgi:hypothetical protein
MTQRSENTSVKLPPNRAVAVGRALFGPMLLRTGIAGVLEVPGRRTGRDIQVTLALWEVDGSLYLMS